MAKKRRILETEAHPDDVNNLVIDSLFGLSAYRHRDKVKFTTNTYKKEEDTGLDSSTRRGPVNITEGGAEVRSTSKVVVKNINLSNMLEEMMNEPIREYQYTCFNDICLLKDYSLQIGDRLQDIIRISRFSIPIFVNKKDWETKLKSNTENIDAIGNIEIEVSSKPSMLENKGADLLDRDALVNNYDYVTEGTNNKLEDRYFRYQLFSKRDNEGKFIHHLDHIIDTAMSGDNPIKNTGVFLQKPSVWSNGAYDLGIEDPHVSNRDVRMKSLSSYEAPHYNWVSAQYRVMGVPKNTDEFTTISFLRSTLVERPSNQVSYPMNVDIVLDTTSSKRTLVLEKSFSEIFKHIGWIDVRCVNSHYLYQWYEGFYIISTYNSSYNTFGRAFDLTIRVPNAIPSVFSKDGKRMELQLIPPLLYLTNSSYGETQRRTSTFGDGHYASIQMYPKIYTKCEATRIVVESPDYNFNKLDSDDGVVVIHMNQGTDENKKAWNLKKFVQLMNENFYVGKGGNFEFQQPRFSPVNKKEGEFNENKIRELLHE